VAAAFLIGHRNVGDGPASAREETLDGVLGIEPVADLRVLLTVQLYFRVVLPESPPQIAGHGGVH